MSEFDIRIGTQLDTSKAESQLADFIKKHSNGKPIEFKLDVKGLGGSVKATDKAFKGFLNTAKQLGNTKIDVSKMLGSATDSVAKGLDKTVGDTTKKLAMSVNRTKRDLVSDATKGIANTTKAIGTEIKNLERDYNRLIDNFNKAGKMQFIDKKSIEKGLSDLKEIGNVKIDISNMSKVKNDISNLGKFLDKTIRDANNNAWKENVGSVKINGLLENLKSVQSVMSAKNMDTSGIDDLIDRTGKLMKLPIGELVQQYAQIRKEFSKELVIPLSVKGVINAETAVKSILDYRKELVGQIAIETDNTKVKQLQEIVQQIDDTVVKLSADLGTVGQSTVKNLIDSSNEKTADKLVKKYQELGKEIDKLNSPKGATFVKLDELNKINSAYENIGKTVNKTNFNKLDSGKINEVANDISNLGKIVDDTSKKASKLSIKAQLDIGFENAEKMLLGMESAITKAGQRSGMLDGLRKQLQEVMDTSKLNPGKGLADLNTLMGKITEEAGKRGLKNLTGELDQYEKYVNDYVNLIKKASNTKDIGMAKTYESEAKRTLKALSSLESGMTKSQKVIADGLRLEANTKANEEFNNSILKTVSTLDTYTKKLHDVNKEVGFDKLVSKAGENARKEYESMIESTNKMRGTLTNMLSSGKIDTTNLAKINTELNGYDKNINKLKNTSINIKCKEAIADLKELRKQEESLGKNVSGIDSNIKKIEDLQSQLSKGLIGGNQVSKEVDAIEKEYASMSKLTKQVNSAQKEYEKLVNTVSGLKQDGNLKNSVFNAIDKQGEKLKDTFANLNYGTLTAVEVSKITGAVEKFASSVNNAQATNLHLKLKADFEIDANSANVKINGLESALLAKGQSTNIVKTLRSQLQKYIETAVNDPSLASKGISGLLSKIDETASKKDLGKITGDLAQYKKYISEIESLSKKANIETDQTLAKKYQKQDQALKNALAQLESGFDKDTLKTAQSLRDKAFDGIGDNVKKEVSKVVSEVEKYKTTMKNATEGYDLSKLSSNIGKGLAKQFDQGISKADELKAKLNEMLSSDNVDVTALTKIRNELESLKKSTAEVNRTSISNAFIRENFDNIQIPNLEKMLQGVRNVMSAKNVDTSGIDNLIAKTKDLSNVDISRLSSEFKAIQDELKKEIEIRLGAKNVKTVEDILNVILKYRNELERQISMEIDSSKVKELNNQLEKTNEVVKTLEGQTSGTLGKALIDQADINNAKQLESTLSDVEKRYESLSKKADGLKGNKNVDISELRNALELSESIKKSIENIRVNPSSSGISKLTGEVDKLDKAIKNAENNAKNIDLNIKFDNNLEKAGNMINGIEASLIKLGQSSGKLNEFRTEFESIKDLSKVNLSGAISQLDDLIRRMKEFGSEKGLGDISGTISQYKQLANEMKSAMTGALKAGTSETASQFEQQASRIDSAMKRLTSSFKEGARESANAFKGQTFNNFSATFEKEVSKVDSSISKFKSSMQNFKQLINFDGMQLTGNKGAMAQAISQEFDRVIQKAGELQNKLKEVMSSDMSAEAKVSEVNRLKSELENLKQTADGLQNKSIIIKCADSIEQLTQLKSKMQEIGQDTRGIDQLIEKFRSLGSKLGNGDIGVDKAVSELRKLDSEASKAGSGFEKLQAKIGNFGTKIQGFFGSIKNAFSSFTLGSMISRSIYSAVNEIKSTITELDSAFADFARVAPDDFTINTSNLEQVASTAKQIAIDVGQSTSDVITGMSTALQAGARTMEQATAIAKSSAIFQNVTDMSAEGASKAVATLINQYFGMDKALSQVDKGVGATVKGYNNLTEAMDLTNYAGNNFAISSEGVTQALSRGGSVLANYGVSLSDSIAMIASANESIQNPERVGNGLKSIAINLGGMKTNAKTGALELNKTAMALKDIAGIDVFTDKSKTSVKDMVTLIEEIKGKWGELTQAQQLGLSEALAGKTQSQVFQSLMNGWERVKEFQDAYNNGFTIGSAQRENEIYLDSIAGKWNTLKETMTKSISTVGVRDAIKDILDMATKAVESVNKISDAFGKVGTFGIGAGIASFVKMMANFTNYSGLTGIAGTVKSLFTGLSGAFATIKTQGVANGFSSISTSLMGVAKASGLARTATILLNGVLNGIVWAVVIAGIQKAIEAWDNYAHATENAIKASKERQDGYRDEAESLSSQISSLEGLADEYDTLSQKVNLTGEEYQRLKELKQEIAEIAPELVTGYDVNGDPILALSDNMDAYIEKIKKARQEKMDLVNYEASLQATEYLKNEKDTQKYKQEAQKAIDMMRNKDGNSAFMGEGNAWKGTKAIQEAGKQWQNQSNAIKKNIADLVTAHEEYEVANNSIKSSVIRNLSEQSKAYKNLTPQVQNEMQQLVQSLDLGDFTQGQIVELNRGLEGIMQNYTNSMSTFGTKQQQAIQQTKEAFQNSTGSIEDYGNALMNAFSDKQKINLTELNDYLSAINEQYGNTGNIEQYQNQLRQVAQVISEITGMDYDTLYKGLRDGFNLEALDQSTVALNNYLDKNKQAIDEWSQAVGDGGKKAREVLEDSFKGVTNFLEGAFSMGGFDIDYLNQVKDQLPKQLQEIARGISKDGKATELEQKFMVAVSTEIANEGEVTDATIKNLEDLLNGATDQIEIQGYFFKGEEAEGIRQLFKDIGWEAKDLKEKLKDNGLKDVLKDAQTLQKELKNLNFADEVNKKIQGLKFDNIGGLKALEEAIGQFSSKEQQIKFTADCGQFFQQASNMKEAIQNMVNSGNGHLILKYDLDVSGDENLQHIKDVYNELPKEIRTLIDTKVIGFDQVVKVKELLIDGGLKDSQITTLMNIKGADEALAKATSLKEFLMLMQDLIVTSQINVETNGTEETEEVITEVENADGTTSEVKVQMTAEGKEKLELVQKLLNGLDGKETESNHTSKADNKELEETEKKQEKVKKDTKSTHTSKADTKELDEAEKKVEKLTVDTHGLVTLNIEGEQQLKATVGEKDKLEVDGKAITYVQIDGMDKYEVSVNDKNQLEVNGVAQTDIEVTGGEKLTFSKNEKGELEVNGKAITNLEVTGTEKVREANQYVDLLRTDAHGQVTITVNGEEAIQTTVNEKGQLEADGRALTYVEVLGGEQYAIAVNEKGQLEVNGKALTDIDISGAEQLTLTKNEKGELEVNGQAITDVMVNGKDEPKEAKKNVDELTKAGNKDVKINIDVSLKETVGEIMSRLGFNKKTEKVDLKVTCTDEATPKIEKILSNNNKGVTIKINGDSANLDNTLNKITQLTNNPVSLKINCDASQVTSVIQNIQSASNKTITVNVSCPNGQNVLNTVNNIASKVISPKSFTVTASGAENAIQQVNKLISAKIANKRFTVTAPGSRDAYNAVVKIQNKKINNKRFTITAPGSAGVISALGTIQSKLNSIHSKSIRVSVTTVYSTIGKPSKESGTVPSANDPQIIQIQKPSFGSGNSATTQAQALGGEIQAVNNNAETLNNAIATNQNTAELMATKTYKANIDTKSTVTAIKYNVDLLNNMKNIISKLSTEIDILGAKMERAWGSSKSKLLKDQIKLLEKQQSNIKVNIKNMEGMAKSLKSSLSKQGFKFKDDGSISNYNSKLIAMEKNVEKLEKKEEAYNKKYSDTSKYSKSKQKSIEKQKEKNSEATEKAKKQLEETKSKLQEYYNLQFSEMPNAKKQWEDLANEIANARAEIIRADREAKTFYEDMKEGILNSRIGRDTTLADTAMAKADLAKSWKDALKYIDRANYLLEKNQTNQQNILKNAQSRANDNRAVLKKYGFNIDSNGWLSAPEKTLEKLRKSKTPEEYEAIKEAYDAYVKDMYETIPEAEKEWWSLQQQIEENKKQIEETEKAMKELVDNADLTQLTAKYERLADTLDLVDAKMEQAHGKHKLQYMEGQISLLERMNAEEQKIIKENQDIARQSKSELYKMGIQFNADGDITNLEGIMNDLRVNGTLEDMEKLQEEVDKYNDSLKNVRDGNKTIVDNENSINSLRDAMIELNQEMKELKDQAWATEFENSIKIVQNRLDKIDSQMELQGANQLDLLNEKIKVYEELAKATEDSLAYQEKKRKELSNTLISYGFKINDDGTINNTAKQLEMLKNTLSDAEFEVVSKALEDYFDVALDEIPSLERELLNFQKEMQDVQKQKLEKTKTIEEEITKIYEKQIDERIDKINEEKEAQVKALNEAKDAYNRYRDEVDYKNDYEEQLKKVEDLQKKLEIAKRDDSLAGQKRVADLMQQLQDEQKNLEKMVQDKIDDDINTMFDDQINKIETDSENEIKNIEDTWSESKIAEMVQQALNTGVFTDIDGNIKSLDTALMEFANNSSEYFGVMGDSLKTELLDNLNVALETMKELQDMSNSLVTQSTNYNKTVVPKSASIGYIPPTSTNQQNVITVGDTVITIEGSADAKTVKEIESILEGYKQDIYVEIMKNVK